MIQTAFIAALGLLACSLSLPQQQQESGKAKKKPSYAVVVNEKLICKQKGDKAKATLKKLFLKQISKWPDGTAAKPYGRKGGTDEQKAFAKLVLNMGDSEIARHWLKLKNMSGTTPPKEVRSDRMLLKYVAKKKGAFGIVKIPAAKAAKGVRVLYEF